MWISVIADAIRSKIAARSREGRSNVDSPILFMRNIARRFGSTVVLEDMNLWASAAR
jgi:hypothetical protein